MKRSECRGRAYCVGVIPLSSMVSCVGVAAEAAVAKAREEQG